MTGIFVACISDMRENCIMYCKAQCCPRGNTRTMLCHIYDEGRVGKYIPKRTHEHFLELLTSLRNPAEIFE